MDVHLCENYRQLLFICLALSSESSLLSPENQATPKDIGLTQCSDEENKSSVSKPCCTNSRSLQGDADLCTFKLGE